MKLPGLVLRLPVEKQYTPFGSSPGDEAPRRTEGGKPGGLPGGPPGYERALRPGWFVRGFLQHRLHFERREDVAIQQAVELFFAGSFLVQQLQFRLSSLRQPRLRVAIPRNRGSTS